MQLHNTCILFIFIYIYRLLLDGWAALHDLLSRTPGRSSTCDQICNFVMLIRPAKVLIRTYIISFVLSCSIMYREFELHICIRNGYCMIPISEVLCKSLGDCNLLRRRRLITIADADLSYVHYIMTRFQSGR
jgi:hypothetical protein